jgi:hypothetical protein
VICSSYIERANGLLCGVLGLGKLLARSAFVDATRWYAQLVADGAQNSQTQRYDPNLAGKTRDWKWQTTFASGVHQCLRELVLDSSAVVCVS